MKKIRNRIYIAVILLLVLVFASCGLKDATIEPRADATTIGSTPEPAPTPEPGTGKAGISEVMSKNKATIMDDDGSFPDWIEIQNLTDTELDINDWQISDDPAGNGMILKGSIGTGGYAAFFASGFSLSEGETVYLFDSALNLVDSFEITSETADVSLTREGPCKYPTPGRANTKEEFANLQSERASSGPIVINEVAVDNFHYYYSDELEYTDWIEIKNISNETVSLSGYCISDDESNLKLYSFPDIHIAPNDVKVILCDKDASRYKGGYPIAPFSLNSESDRLYLSDSEGNIIDYVALRDIPYNGTYGRMDGENGFFYFVKATPESGNTNGKRYVADTPVSLTKDGPYDDVSSVSVELTGTGILHYTLDGTVPTEESPEYTGPIVLDRTTIVRAISVEDGAVNSRPLTMSFLINEYHTLPIASVVSDNKDEFHLYFQNGYKVCENPGVISYYDENGSFTMGAGIKLNGDTSLKLAKKNLTFRFRGCYGADELNYDIFGEGVDHFTNLQLRAGQEQLETIVRGEACTNLLKDFSDSVVYQRSRYCVVYVDGKYNGIYSIKDKLNEQMYADLKDVSKSSVEMAEATVYENSPFFSEVYAPIIYNNMSDDAKFIEATKYLDLQSLIDWTVLEAWTGNFDLQSGNLKYVRSSKTDGRWQLCLYDLDCAFYDTSYIYDFVLNYPPCQVATINSHLLQNENYRAMLLQRASEVYGTYITDEKIIEQLNLLAEEIEPELERDGTVSGLGEATFHKHLDALENKILNNGWTDFTIEKLCRCLRVTDEERMQYFGN